MRIIDSHTHIDFSNFDMDRDKVILRAQNAGISDIIVSSTTAERWQLVKNVCDENNTICHPAYGLHPMFMGEHQLAKTENDLQRLEHWLKNNNAIAIGEIGLDYFIQEADKENREGQLRIFIKQLEIADEMNLPVIIHARKSLDIVLKQLRLFPSLRGSIHSFSGSEQQAKQLIDLGFYLGFGGPITYDRATRLHKLIQAIPLQSILVETDSPDQPDASHHMQRNEPAYITHVIDKIADLKNEDRKQVAAETTRNALELFKFNNF